MKLLYTNKNRDSELCHSCNVKVYSDTHNYIFHLNKCEKYTLICADNKVLIYGPSFTDVNSLSIISEKLSFILKLYPDEIVDTKDVLDGSEIINT